MGKIFDMGRDNFPRKSIFSVGLPKMEFIDPKNSLQFICGDCYDKIGHEVEVKPLGQLMARRCDRCNLAVDVENQIYYFI